MTMSETQGGSLHHADLLTRVTRDRAHAYTALSEARIELEACQQSLRNALLELCVARELLNYHGLTPTP